MSRSGKEEYLDWRPVEGVPARIHCEAIHDDVEGLRILLHGDDPSGPTLRLRFESVVGYRNINESYRLRTWGQLDMSSRSPLLRVRNSQWVDWLAEEAGGVFEPANVTHYAVFTSEDCIDIASEFAPTVEWLNTDE